MTAGTRHRYVHQAVQHHHPQRGERERAAEYYTQAAGKASDLYSQAAEKVSDAAQTARETAARQTSTVAAAIDAGKKAYQEEKRKTELSGRIEASPNYPEKAN